MVKVLLTATVVAMSVAVSAHASTVNVRGGGLFEARQLITTTLDNDNSIYVPSAAEKDGTARIRILTTAGNFTCSGSVIGRDAVLTAAHCVNIPGATVTGVQVYFGGGSAASGFGATGLGPYTGRAPDRLATSIETNPYYFDPVYGAGAGNPVVGIGDLAVLRLNGDVPVGTKILQLYNGDPLGKTAAHISYGTRGTGADGGNIGVDLTALFEGRKGSNVYDGTYEGIFQDLPNGFLPTPGSLELLNLVQNSQLVYDFDPLQAVTDLAWGGPLDGISFWKELADNGYNVFVCPAGTFIPGFGTCTGNEFINDEIDLAFFGASLGDIESLIDGGDSGGAALIDGMVAGIHSFGTTLGTSNCRRFVNKPDLLCGNNSSFGEVAGDTNVAAYYGWIRNAAGIPEPSTIALLFAAVIGMSLARRRKIV